MMQFVHTADIHFGMENYGRIDPQSGIHSRLLDFERALNFVIDVAVEKKVDFFLFAGDAYKTAHPSPTQQKLLVRCLMRLYKVGIPVIIVVGNHDNPLSFGKAHSLDIFQNLPLDGFHVVSKPTVISLNTKNGPVNIVGIPWPTRNMISLSQETVNATACDITQYISAGVARIIAEMAQQLDPKIPAVLSGHLTVSSGVFSGSEKRAIYGNDPVLLPSQLAIAPFDYVALGHLHRYQNLNPNGYPAIVYAGSPERVDFGERKEDKGFCLVTIHEKGNTEHQFIKTPMRPFIQIDVDLKPDKDQTEQLLAAFEKYNLENAVVKVVYQVPTGKRDTVDLKIIQKALAQAWYVAGIIPIRTPETRERRLALPANTDLAGLLGTYFLSRPECCDKKDHLVEMALELLEQAAEPDGSTGSP